MLDIIIITIFTILVLYYCTYTILFLQKDIEVRLLFCPWSLWIGIHHSKFTRKFCLNYIPCITISFWKRHHNINQS